MEIEDTVFVFVEGALFLPYQTTTTIGSLAHRSFNAMQTCLIFFCQILASVKTMTFKDRH